jgi:hypothetical protein
MHDAGFMIHDEDFLPLTTGQWTSAANNKNAEL